MAHRQKTLALSKSNFAESLLKISTRFSLTKVFDDFLTITIAACTQNLATKLSYYEEEYLQTVAHYKDSDLRFEFPNAFAHLIIEMEERMKSEYGNDVLGEFFEQYIANDRNAQFFTPYPVCMFMAQLTHFPMQESEAKLLRILEPACGSGRMLLAAQKIFGRQHAYYGIDRDLTCIKMASLNLFLNGMWKSEVMCADTLQPDDFVIAYRISCLPLGIFKIEQKEQSTLWNIHSRSFQKDQTINDDNNTPIVSSQQFNGNANQLSFF